MPRLILAGPRAKGRPDEGLQEPQKLRSVWRFSRMRRAEQGGMDMLYAVKALFRPGFEERRASLAADFGQHIRQPLLHIRLVGGLFDANGVRTGILMLMEAESREQLDHFVMHSPYAEAGLYQSVDVDELQIEAGSLG